MPYYLGHNVATRQEIRERETFAKRLMSSAQDQLTMAISPEELLEFCDAWADDVYRHTPHGGLKGMTPWQVRRLTGEVRRLTGEQERALDVLLMDSGWREITKKGIRLDGMRYDAAALGSHEGERAQVRVDPTDRTLAWIFNEDGDFLGVTTISLSRAFSASSWQGAWHRKHPCRRTLGATCRGRHPKYLAYGISPLRVYRPRLA